MKQSTNYNMNKPDPNDMFSLEHWNQNTDKIDETLAPTFEDYTGETPVPTTDEALKNIKSKTKLSILMQNIKAFCKGCCTLGMLVDNCVTNNNNLPLAASQGKILMDQITSLNNNIGNTGKYLRTDNIDNAAETLWPKIEGSSSYDFTWIPENAGGITAGAKARVIGSYINSEYETQMVLSYLSSAPVVQREKINGSWGEWKAFVIKSDLFTYEQKFENKDLNTIISPGCYGIGGKPSVSGATNYPEDTTGMLVVFCNTGVVAQHYYTYLGSMYLRSKLVNYNNWSSWEKITK